MRKFARRPDKDRMDLFRETARTMGTRCNCRKGFLGLLDARLSFHLSPFAELLVFRWNQLSKAYGAISRFSEDVDLILIGVHLVIQLTNPGESSAQRNRMPLVVKLILKRRISPINFSPHWPKI